VNNARIGWFVLCPVFATIVSTAVAAKAQGLSSLNPFGHKENGRAKASVADEPQRRLSWPKLELPKVDLLPNRAAATPKKTRAPSPLTKLSRSAKQLWSKTKAAVTPSSWSSKKTAKTSALGSQAHHRSGTKAKTAKRKPFYSALLPRKEEEKKIETVNDFLALPKPSL
jgi:hypothetical protein